MLRFRQDFLLIVMVWIVNLGFTSVFKANATTKTLLNSVENFNHEKKMGYVCNEDGEPLAFVEILMSGDYRQIIRVTDEYGVFSIPLSLIPNSNEKPVSKSKIDTIEIRFADRSPVVLSIQLFQEKGYRYCLEPEKKDYEELIIVGRKLSMAFAPENINKLEIYTNASSKSDPVLAVASLPGVTNMDGSADPQFRGTGLGLSQIYLNDVPLYEVIKGSSLDQTTRGFSVFNTSVIESMEVHPSNPPSFLANSSIGAIRVLPDTQPEEAKTFFMGVTGFGVTAANVWNNDAFTQFYGTLTDLDGFIQLNDNASDMVTEYFSFSGAGSTYWDVTDTTSLYLFNSIDTEEGDFPLAFLNTRTNSSIDRKKSHNIASLEHGAFNHRIKFDLAYTKTSNNTFFGENKNSAENDYAYVSMDVAGRSDFINTNYRMGILKEDITLSSSGAVFENTSRVEQVSNIETSINYRALYVYVTAEPLSNVSIAVGAKQNLSEVNQHKAAYQASLAIESSNLKHKAIVGAGRYFSTFIPENVSFNDVVDSESEQLSIDYTYSQDDFEGGMSIYQIESTVDGVETNIYGSEVFIADNLTENLRISSSFATSRPKIKNFGLEFKAENYLDYFAKLSIRYNINSNAFLNVSYSTRNGGRYTKVLGTEIEDDSARLIPTFSSDINGERLKAFQSLDVSYINILRFWPGDVKPIYFVGLTNIFDHKNEVRATYSADYTQRESVLLERRSLAFGAVFRF